MQICYAIAMRMQMKAGSCHSPRQVIRIRSMHSLDEGLERNARKRIVFGRANLHKICVQVLGREQHAPN